MFKKKAENEEEVKVEATKEEAPKKARKPLDTSTGSVIWTIWHYTEAVLLVVLGILAIVFSDNKDLQSIFIYIIGSFLIADGACRILMNLLPVFSVKEKAKLAYNFVTTGSIELALGIVIIMAKNMGLLESMTLLFCYFLAIIFIIAGAAFLIFAIAFIITKLYKLYMPILEIVLSAALIAVGVVIFVYMKTTNTDVFYRILLIIAGVFVTLGGVVSIVTTSTALVAANRKKQVLKAAENIRKEAEAASKDFTDEEAKPADDNVIEEKKDDDVKGQIVDADSEEKKDDKAE
jgi:hypothetical protein